MTEAVERAGYLLSVAAQFIRDHGGGDKLIEYDDAQCDGECLADDCVLAAEALRSLTGEGEPVACPDRPAVDLPALQREVAGIIVRDVLQEEYDDLVEGYLDEIMRASLRIIRLPGYSVVARAFETNLAASLLYTRPQPVAWRWRAIFDDASRGGWFYETGPLSRHIHTRQGLEYQPLYTRPVAWPDREAVARIIGAACGVTWANGVAKYGSTSEDDRPIDRFYRAADALLSASDGAGR